jgi:hypothetical protein
VQQTTGTTDIGEVFGMSPDELRAEFKKAFARLKWAVNGYEMVEFLKWLIQGCVGCELIGSIEWVGCYCRGEDNDGGVWVYASRRSAEALERMGLIESRTTSGNGQPWLWPRIYVATTSGQRFFDLVPEGFRGGEPYQWKPGEDQQLWTAIVTQALNERSSVYPFIAEEKPDAATVLSVYDAVLQNDCSVTITGPHSLRWIPPSALGLDPYPAVGPRIIRSWFDTVINPMLESMKLEQRLLEERNWTWRVPPGHLESLRPIGESPWQVSIDNLEQLISFYPDVDDLIERHDLQASELEDACRVLHKALSASGAIKEAYASAKQDDALPEQGTAVNSVLYGSDEQHLDLLAQYIVNTAGDLPNYYVYSAVWNKYRSDFLLSLEEPVISPLRDATIQAGERLLGTVNNLSVLLKEIRARLSLKFDVPFITSQSATDE